MDVQGIIVAIIGVVVLGYVIRRLYCIITKKDMNICVGCDKNCPMKRKKRESKKECGK